jgi:hypothetical protein
VEGGQDRADEAEGKGEDDGGFDGAFHLEGPDEEDGEADVGDFEGAVEGDCDGPAGELGGRSC